MSSTRWYRGRWWARAIRPIVLALVAWGIWRALAAASAELAGNSFPLQEIGIGWLALAAALYVLGTLPMALFWRATLRSMGQRPGLGELFWAYYVGHLGKYVPGKALVVVLRAGLIRSSRVDGAVAAVSVFVETLTMMTVGAFVASAVIAVWYADRWQVLLLSVIVMIGTGVPTLPPIFRRIVRLLGAAGVDRGAGAAAAGVTYRLMAVGYASNLIGWVLLGLSFWATLRAMPMAAPAELFEVAPLATAGVCSAVVAGFVSLIPGGIGVREWVLHQLVAPQFGPTVAIVSAVTLRLVWLLTELVICGILYALVGRGAGRADRASRQH